MVFFLSYNFQSDDNFERVTISPDKKVEQHFNDGDRDKIDELKDNLPFNQCPDERGAMTVD